MNKIFNKSINYLLSKLNKTTIMLPNPQTGIKEKYLTRYYLFGKDRKFGNIYIHQFHSSDLEDDFHNHPFKYSLSFIVKGGYVEELYSNGKIYNVIRLPFSFNFINTKIFHKVSLIEKESWSIFFAGPRTNDWGFLDSKNGEFRHWTTSPNAIE